MLILWVGTAATVPEIISTGNRHGLIGGRMAATLLKRPGVVSAAEHGPMTSLRRFTTGFRLAGLALLRFARLPTERARRGTLHGLETIEIFLGGFGLVAALVAAALLSPALGALPGAAGD